MRRPRNRIPAPRWLGASLPLIRALVIASVLLQPAVCQSQVSTAITPTAGAGNLGTQVNQAANVYNITGGTPRGSNLFHSFGLFSVGAGDIANFWNSNGLLNITNILSRVTGGQVSNIYGTIQTAGFGGAHLWLINPAGVIFGPGASLDVGGSFHVSTANYLKFPDGNFFATNTPLPANGLTANPLAFGFLNGTPPATIVVDLQGAHDTVLHVPNGETLSLVGGDIQVRGTTLSAPSGRVQIVSVASAGEVTIPDLDVSSFAQLGQISLSAGSVLDASGDPAGTVVIRGGRLMVASSRISANTQGDVDGARVGIDLRLAEEIALTTGSSIETATLSGEGRGGDIQLEANRVTIDGASVRTRTSSFAGDAGDIWVDAGTVTLTGGASIKSLNLSFGSGQGGNIAIRATDSIAISGHNSFGVPTSVGSDVLFSGNGGRVTLSAPSLTMDASNITSGTFSSSPDDRGGDILLEVGRLSLTHGATVNSFSGSLARGGNIQLTATGSAFISDPGSGIFTSSFGDTPAGGISLDVGALTLAGGALIQSGTIAGTQGGNVTVAARDSILISDGSGITSQAFVQNVGQVALSAPTVTIDNGFISTSTIGSGRAGDIALNVGQLRLLNGGQITSSNEFLASGGGGNVTVTATDSVSIGGTSPSGVPASPFSNDPRSGIFSTTRSIGPAGQIAVSAPTLTMADGGKISAATSGGGPAGNILLTLSDFTLTGGARVDSSTTGSGHGGTIAVNASGGMLTISDGGGLFSTAGGSGAGGDINVQAGQMHLLDGAIISTKSSGTDTALAGNVNINAGSLLRMANSTITTESLVADGGNISITTTGSLVHLSDSQITTSVQSGIGSGGNITIDSQLIVLDGSRIRADAFGGPGGNIDITAEVYLTQNSLVTASSALSTPGTINIQASITDVSGTLARLPEAVLQAAALLRASCAARLAGGKSSSLVLAGREGLPLEPGSLLPSPLVLEGPAELRLSSSEEHPWWETLLRAPRVSLDPTCSR